MAFKDYYAELGVAPVASHEQIRLAFRRMARQFHPDMNSSPEAEERFKAINEAHEVLTDAARRAAYDQMRRKVQEVPALKSATRRGFEDILARVYHCVHRASIYALTSRCMLDFAVQNLQRKMLSPT